MVTTDAVEQAHRAWDEYPDYNPGQDERDAWTHERDRMAAALAAARAEEAERSAGDGVDWTLEQWQEWSNEVASEMPEEWDGDEAQEDLILRFVKHAAAHLATCPASAGEAVDRRLLAIAGQALDSWDQAPDDTDDVALDAARTMADALRALVRHGYALAAARAGEVVSKAAYDETVALLGQTAEAAAAERRARKAAEAARAGEAVDREALASWTPAEVAASPVGASRVIQSLAAWGDVAPSEVEWGCRWPDGGIVAYDDEAEARAVAGHYDGTVPVLVLRTMSSWREVRDA